MNLVIYLWGYFRKGGVMINNIKVCCVQKVIPLAFDESMSYLEMLCAMLKSVNETIDEVNRLSNIVDNIDVNFDDINEKIDNINAQITNLNNGYTELSSKIDVNTENINLTNERITNEINELDTTLRSLINSNYTTLKTYVDAQDFILNEKIDNIQIGAISVYDPTTGLLSPLQTVINNLAQASNKDGLTASEFDLLELTASGFDAYNITAYEFDSAGKIILV